MGALNNFLNVNSLIGIIIFSENDLKAGHSIMLLLKLQYQYWYKYVPLNLIKDSQILKLFRIIS